MKGFVGCNLMALTFSRLALDVGVLTEDHAGALPVNSKAGKCSFRLSADGKTLFLSVPGTAKGTMIVVN